MKSSTPAVCESGLPRDNPSSKLVVFWSDPDNGLHEGESDGEVARLGNPTPTPEFLHIIDPANRTGKVTIPTNKIYDTQGMRNALVNFSSNSMKDLSLCMLFQKSNCHMGRQCHQIHACKDLIAKIREETQGHSTCCAFHDNKTIPPSDPTHILLSNSSELLRIPATYFAHTAKPINQYMMMKEVCKLHQQNRCKYGKDCKHIHLCRTYLAGRGAPEPTHNTKSRTTPAERDGTGDREWLGRDGNNRRRQSEPPAGKKVSTPDGTTVAAPPSTPPPPPPPPSPWVRSSAAGGSPLIAPSLRSSVEPPPLRTCRSDPLMQQQQQPLPPSSTSSRSTSPGGALPPPSPAAHSLSCGMAVFENGVCISSNIGPHEVPTTPSASSSASSVGSPIHSVGSATSEQGLPRRMDRASTPTDSALLMALSQQKRQTQQQQHQQHQQGKALPQNYLFSGAQVVNASPTELFFSAPQQPLKYPLALIPQQHQLAQQQQQPQPYGESRMRSQSLFHTQPTEVPPSRPVMVVRTEDMYEPYQQSYQPQHVNGTQYLPDSDNEVMDRTWPPRSRVFETFAQHQQQPRIHDSSLNTFPTVSPPQSQPQRGVQQVVPTQIRQHLAQPFGAHGTSGHHVQQQAPAVWGTERAARQHPPPQPPQPQPQQHAQQWQPYGWQRTDVRRSDIRRSDVVPIPAAQHHNEMPVQPAPHLVANKSLTKRRLTVDNVTDTAAYSEDPFPFTGNLADLVDDGDNTQSSDSEADGSTGPSVDDQLGLSTERADPFIITGDSIPSRHVPDQPQPSKRPQATLSRKSGSDGTAPTVPTDTELVSKNSLLGSLLQAIGGQVTSSATDDAGEISPVADDNTPTMGAMSALRTFRYLFDPPSNRHAVKSHKSSTDTETA